MGSAHTATSVSFVESVESVDTILKTSLNIISLERQLMKALAYKDATVKFVT